MNKYLAIFCVLLISLIQPTVVSAHTVGQQSFFKINDKYAAVYPVPSSSIEDFSLPQDIAPQSYLVHEPITFEIDPSRLPMVNSDVLEKLKFSWNFGNGDTFTGVKTSYVYPKIGSYVLTISVADDTSTAPVLLESVMLHILPNKTYKLPKAIITMNNITGDTIQVPFSNAITFDASASKTGSAPLRSFFWDFGDMKSSTRNVEIHSFASDVHVVFPVLRITDANGFISDTFVQVNNSLVDTIPSEGSSKNTKIFVILFSLILLCGIFGIMLYTKRKK